MNNIEALNVDYVVCDHELTSLIGQYATAQGTIDKYPDDDFTDEIKTLAKDLFDQDIVSTEGIIADIAKGIGKVIIKIVKIIKDLIGNVISAALNRNHEIRALLIQLEKAPGGTVAALNNLRSGLTKKGAYGLLETATFITHGLGTLVDDMTNGDFASNDVISGLKDLQLTINEDRVIASAAKEDELKDKKVESVALAVMKSAMTKKAGEESWNESELKDLLRKMTAVNDAASKVKKNQIVHQAEVLAKDPTLSLEDATAARALLATVVKVLAIHRALMLFTNNQIIRMAKYAITGTL